MSNVALRALREETDYIAEHGSPHLPATEMSQVLLALNELINGQQATGEVLTRFTQRLVDIEDEIKRDRQLRNALEKKIENIVANVSPQEHEQAEARLAQSVAQQAVMQRAVLEMERSTVKQRLEEEPREEIFWPFEGEIIQNNGVRITIAGHTVNRLPRSIVIELRNRIRRMELAEAQKNIMRVGRRTNGDETIRSWGQVQHELAAANTRYSAKPINDGSLSELLTSL